MGLTTSPLVSGGQWTDDNSARHASLLHRLLDIGELLMASGAEVNRVEDTLTRMGKAYGASHMNVFVITTSIVVTMIFPDGTERTQTRRIRNGGSTDFTLLEDLNALSRRCCANPLPVEDLKEKIEEIRARKHSDLLYYVGNVVGAGSFTAFFAGTLPDIIAASILGLLVSAMRKRLGKITPTPVIDNFVGSFLTGCLLGGTVQAMPFLHMDAIIIGEVMLFVPGIAMTNAVRDVLSGDTMAGMMRLLESLLWTVALACGFMASLALINMLS